MGKANNQLGNELEQMSQQLTALNKIDRVITGTMDLQVTMETVVDQIALTLKPDAVDILLLNPDTNTFEFCAGYGFKTDATKDAKLRLGEGLAGQAAFEQRVISIQRLPATSSDLLWQQFIQDEGFISYHAVPVIVKGVVKGIIETFHRDEFVPDRYWLGFLEAVGRQTAIAIENFELFNDLMRTNTELVHAIDGTLEGWVQALDLRDEETEGHSRRVVDLTLELARMLDVDHDKLDHIRRGALLHDIGKLGVPEHILLSKGKVTTEEMKIIQLHPVFASKWLAKIKFLQPALEIPYCHHENWDGSGYPRGLKGEQIPLSARIFAVVDVWDALLSDRYYRKAWLREDVLSYLCEQSGVHFDPRVVDIFLEMVSKE